MLDLNLVRIFVTVYQQGGFTHAARTLDLSQPAVSLAIRRLEEQIGESLFIRKGRIITPTARADALINDMQSALETIENRLSSNRELQVYCIEVMLSQLGYLNGASFKTPPLDPDVALQDLRSNKVDLIIDHCTTRDPAFIVETVYQDWPVVVCRKDHPRITGDSITKEAFLAEKHVVLQSRREGISFLELLTTEIVGSREDKLEMNSVSGVTMMTVKTNFIALLPKRFIEEWLEPLGLKSFPMPMAHNPIDFHMIYHRRNQNDPFHAEFRERVRRCFYTLS
ncbi:LysR family transcriptional regulator [Vibrio astriarenae]|uniref:LysR family transcriptional regulator n=1 Tax=Vibrio astriarenae TaxID=1481923 RepID=UPI003735CC73